MITPKPPAGAELIRHLTQTFDTVTSVVTLSGGTEMDILHPKSAEDLIDEAAFEKDERLPYWADVWPSAVILAELLVGTDGAGIHLLELGCGCGVVSTACAKAGFDILATDYYPDALEFARANVWQNTGRELATQLVDWRSPPTDLGTFDMIVASDVLYEPDKPALVAEMLARSLRPRGFALIADPGRMHAVELQDEVALRGLDLKQEASLPFTAGKQRQSIDIYRVTRMTRGKLS